MFKICKCGHSEEGHYCETKYYRPCADWDEWGYEWRYCSCVNFRAVKDPVSGDYAYTLERHYSDVEDLDIHTPSLRYQPPLPRVWSGRSWPRQRTNS